MKDFTVDKSDLHKEVYVNVLDLAQKDKETQSNLHKII